MKKRKQNRPNQKTTCNDVTYLHYTQSLWRCHPRRNSLREIKVKAGSAQRFCWNLLTIVPDAAEYC